MHIKFAKIDSTVALTFALFINAAILSLQLSFAVFPLVMFTNSKAKMGEFANGPATRLISWLVAIFIAVLNAWLLWLTFRDWFHL